MTSMLRLAQGMIRPCWQGMAVALLCASACFGGGFQFGPRPLDPYRPQIYDHINPERFSANPPAPFDPYYAYPHLNSPKRAYPYGWFGARSRPKDNYYRGTRGTATSATRWPGQ